jgi:hypothetical protein
MQLRLFLPAVIAISLLAPVARAQVAPPFFNPAGVAAFTPEVDVVMSGVIQDVQAVVSSDRKYVTLNMRPSNSNLIALRDFTFQNGAGLGFVGSSGPNGGGNAGNVGNGNAGAAAGNVNNIAAGQKAQAVQAPAPAPVPAKPSVLDRPGMTRMR